MVLQMQWHRRAVGVVECEHTLCSITVSYEYVHLPIISPVNLVFFLRLGYINNSSLSPNQLTYRQELSLMSSDIALALCGPSTKDPAAVQKAPSPEAIRKALKIDLWSIICCFGH